MEVVGSSGAVLSEASPEVTLDLASGAGAAMLLGARTVVARAGVARFTDLSVDAAAAGIALTASASCHVSATSSPFDVAAPLAPFSILRRGLPLGSALQLAATPWHDQTLYAITANGLARSNDAGVTWTTLPALSARQAQFLKLYFDPVAEGTLYVSGSGAAQRSTDAGVTWTPCGAGAASWLAIDPSKSGTLYASVSGKLFKSVDGCATWSPVSTPTTIDAIGMAPGGDLYAGARSAVFRSADGGTKWDGPFALPISVSDMLSSFVFDSGHPGTVLAVVHATGVVRSTDRGATWTMALKTPAELAPVAVDGNSGALLIGQSTGLSLSQDGGKTWSPLRGGALSSCGWITSLSWSPRSGVFFAGGLGGLCASADGGATWSLLPILSDGSVRAISLDPSQAGTLFVRLGSGDVYKSMTAGASFTLAHGRGTNGVSFGPVAVSPASSRTVYAPSSGGVWKSPDGGASWAPSSAGLGPVSAVAAVGHGGGGETVISVTAGTSSNKPALLRSEDGGATWTLVAPGPAGARCVVDLVTDSVLCGGSGGPLLLVSSNAAATWSAINGPFGAIDALAAARGVGWVASAGSLFKTTDATNWAQATPSEIRGSSGVQALAVNPRDGATVYLKAGWYGLFRSSDGGASWTQVLFDSTQETTPALAVDPFVAARVYAGTETGLLRTLTGFNK